MAEVFLDKAPKATHDTTRNVYQRMHAVMRQITYVEKSAPEGGEYAAMMSDAVVQNAIHIFGGLKELPVLLVLIEVEVGSVFIISFAKLFQEPGLAHLTNTLEDQWLAVGGVLPRYQLIHDKSFHQNSPSHFYWVLRA